MKHILYIISVFCLFNATLFGQNQVADTTDLKLISNINKGKVVTVTSTAYQGDYTATNVSQTPNALTVFASSVRNGWYWVKLSDVMKLTRVASQDEILKLSAQAGEEILISTSGLLYVVQNSAVSGYTTDSAVVIPTKNNKYAVLQPNIDGRYAVSALKTFTPTSMEKFFDFIGVRGGGVLWDRNVTLTFANNEDIDINYDIDIVSPKKDTLFVPTEPIDGLDYTVFTKNDNVNFSINNLVVRGPKDGRKAYSGEFTRIGNTVTIPSGIVDATDCGSNLCDEGRYIYFNDTVRARITAANSSTEVEIANTSGIPTSGTATIYRDNDCFFLYTTGSTIPASKNLITDVPLAGQRFIRTNPELDKTYLGGYIYITIDGEDYERRITRVSGDTLFFSNQLPDSITTYPTTATIGKWAEIKLTNVDIAGEWGNSLYWTGGDGIWDIDNCTFGSNVSIAAMFGNNASKNARFHARNSFFIETGIGYYGDGNNHPTDPNGIGIYLHPHINTIIDNCYFYGNYRDHIKFFSSSDSQTTIAKYQKVNNCHFEYGGSALQESLYNHFDIINYTRGTATISNCTGDGKVQIRGSTNLVSSKFDKLIIANPRDSAVYNITNCEFTRIAEITGAGTYEYFGNVSNTRIVDTEALGQGIMGQHGTWVVSGCWIDIQGANGVGIRSQGATFYISDTYIKTYHTSGNYFALDVNGTQYDDIDFYATDVTILGGQISITGSASFTERVFFNRVKFADGCTDCSIRFVGSNIDLYENNRGTNAGMDTLEYSAADDVIELRKNMDYEMYLDAAGAPIISIKGSDGVETGILWRDEFKINFVSSAVFSSGNNFDFTRTFAAGDWVVLKRTADKWFIAQQNDADTAGNAYLTEADTAAMLAPYSKFDGAYSSLTGKPQHEQVKTTTYITNNYTIQDSDSNKVFINNTTSNYTITIDHSATTSWSKQQIEFRAPNTGYIRILVTNGTLTDGEANVLTADTIFIGGFVYLTSGTNWTIVNGAVSGGGGGGGTYSAGFGLDLATNVFSVDTTASGVATQFDIDSILSTKSYLTSTTGYIQDSLYTQSFIDSALISQAYRELNQNDTLKTTDFGKILYNDDTSNDTLYIPAGITADVISQYVKIESYSSASIVIISSSIQFRDIENTLIDTLTVKAAAIRRVAPDKFRMLSSSKVYITESDTASMLTPYINRSDTSAMLASYIQRSDTAAMLTPYISRNDTASMLSYYYDKTEIDSALISQSSRELNQNDTLKTTDFGKVVYNNDATNDTLYIPTALTPGVISQFVGVESYGNGSVVIIEMSGVTLTDIENIAVDTTIVRATAIRSLSSNSYKILSKTTGEFGWAIYNDTAYATADDSLLIPDGTTAILPIKADMTAALANNYLPYGVDSLWSQFGSKIIPTAVGATYTVRLRFKTKHSATNSYGEINFDIGGEATPTNIVNSSTIFYPKGANIETLYSETSMLYSLDTFVANGCQIAITADGGDIEIYDISIMIRVDSTP